MTKSTISGFAACARVDNQSQACQARSSVRGNSLRACKISKLGETRHYLNPIALNCFSFTFFAECIIGHVDSSILSVAMARRLPRSGPAAQMITPTTKTSPAKTRSKIESHTHAPTSNAATHAKAMTMTSPAPSGSLKRKRTGPPAGKPLMSTPAAKTTPLDADDDEEPSSKPTKKQKKKQEEKRSRIFRKKAPLSFLEKLQRAQTQR